MNCEIGQKQVQKTLPQIASMSANSLKNCLYKNEEIYHVHCKL